jgi:hypothetical protein
MKGKLAKLSGLEEDFWGGVPDWGEHFTPENEEVGFDWESGNFPQEAPQDAGEARDAGEAGKAGGLRSPILPPSGPPWGEGLDKLGKSAPKQPGKDLREGGDALSGGAKYWDFLCEFWELICVLSAISGAKVNLKPLEEGGLGCPSEDPKP